MFFNGDGFPLQCQHDDGQCDDPDLASLTQASIETLDSSQMARTPHVLANARESLLLARIICAPKLRNIAFDPDSTRTHDGFDPSRRNI